MAGVPKDQGSAELKADGGILWFDEEYIFKGEGHEPFHFYNKVKEEWEIITGTGKTGAIYDDDINKFEMVEDHMIHLTKCVTIIEMDYEMSWSKSYYLMRYLVEANLDLVLYSDYNKKW